MCIPTESTCGIVLGTPARSTAVPTAEYRQSFRAADPLRIPRRPRILARRVDRWMATVLGKGVKEWRSSCSSSGEKGTPHFSRPSQQNEKIARAMKILCIRRAWGPTESTRAGNFDHLLGANSTRPIELCSRSVPAPRQTCLYQIRRSRSSTTSRGMAPRRQEPYWRPTDCGDQPYTWTSSFDEVGTTAATCVEISPGLRRFSV